MPRLLFALLLACALPLHAAEVRLLQWSELIPEGAPPPPPPPSMPSVSAQGIQAPEAPPTHKPTAQRGEKVRLVYTDTIRCPEEKMASLPKYAYVEPAL